MKHQPKQKNRRESPREHSTSGVLNVVECIRRQIKSGQWNRDGKTPPVRELRIACGSSIESVLKALHYLVSIGELARVPGKNRYYLPEAVHDLSQKTEGDRRPPRWVEISEEIRSELEQGRYAAREGSSSAASLCSLNHPSKPPSSPGASFDSSSDAKCLAN